LVLLSERVWSPSLILGSILVCDFNFNKLLLLWGEATDSMPKKAV
jgi:hypothetical protein